MKITCIGGGPAGLYFAILMKKADPAHQITIYERNRADDTFGWGVVFSRETLSHFQQADAPSYDQIRASFRYWDNIDTYYQRTCVTSGGHGFCGLSRQRLLNILQQRCRELGVELLFQTELDPARDTGADLVVAADGVQSRTRELYRDVFQPTIELGRCRFTWLGTTLPLSAFTFIYRHNEHGLFQVHAYPYEPDLSTFIVECHEDVWRRAGLDRASEDDTLAYCERLFQDELRGHRLLSNRSIWRTFPEITNQRWYHRNIVLLGDAVHTAHFSIGSGTKLAMEDAIALQAAFQQHGTGDIPAALAAYEAARRPDVLRLQRVARISQEWFQDSAVYHGQEPLTFTFNQLTRSMRITWDNLRLRDPEFVGRVQARFSAAALPSAAPPTPAPPPMFTALRLRDLELRNRVVFPSDRIAAADDGLVGDEHLVHLGARAAGGAGLLLTETVAVAPEGRSAGSDPGLYRADHLPPWRRIVDFVHRRPGARIGVRLGHAAPAGELWRADMERLLQAFADAARWAGHAGFDLVEVDLGGGGLLASFVSPLCNRRGDDYGGAIGRRMRFPLEVVAAVRAAFPAARPLSVRLAATDWVPAAAGGLSEEDAVAAAGLLREAGCDVLAVVGGGAVPGAKPPHSRLSEVPLCARLRRAVGILTMVGGNLQSGDDCNTILAAGRADLCLVGRQHLRDPYFTRREAARYGLPET